MESTGICWVQSWGGSLGLPVESAFLNGVYVAKGENAREREHAPEDGGAVLDDRVFVDDGPRIHEHDFQIEQNEEHRDEIELHAETGLATCVGDHAALVGGVFGGVAFGSLAEDDAD